MFITFEGGEGAGKNKIWDLKHHLDAQGYATEILREPGSTPLCEKIRALLLDSKNTNMDSIAELMLYQAARAQLLSECIVPALQSGVTVLCDRFMDSTRVYQGFARGHSTALISFLEGVVVGDYKPNFTYLLDVDPVVGLARSKAKLAQMKTDEGRFEAEKLAFHEKVRAGYLAVAEAEPDRFIVIDTTRMTIPEVTAEIIRQFDERIRPQMEV